MMTFTGGNSFDIVLAYSEKGSTVKGKKWFLGANSIF